jgi:hypothetical protein
VGGGGGGKGWCSITQKIKTFLPDDRSLILYDSGLQIPKADIKTSYAEPINP